MEHLEKLAEIKEIFEKGKNITSYFKENEGVSNNSLHAIEISYDLQAGSYIKVVNENKEFNFNYTTALAKVISKLGCNSILEAGVGEATTLGNLVDKLQNKNKIQSFGFDISWSRIKYGARYCSDLGIKNVQLFIGDLFKTPLMPNSIDIVYTSHSIEPNGGREKEAIRELFSVAKEYLILLEPSYEFASGEGKSRMDKLGYVKGIEKAVKELGYEIVEHRLFDYCINPLNPTAITIIKKGNKENEAYHSSPFACPITKTKLKKSVTSFYSDKSLLMYPIVEGVPCLLPKNAIIATKFNEF